MVRTEIRTRILVHPSKLWIHIVQTLSPRRNEPSLDKTELGSRHPSFSHQRQINPTTGRTYPPLSQAQTHHPPTPVPIFLRTKLTSPLASHQKAQPPHTTQRATGYHPTPLSGTHHLFKSLQPRDCLLDNSNPPKSTSETTEPVHHYLTPKLRRPLRPLRPLNNAHPQEPLPDPEEPRAPDAAHEPWELAT